MKKLISFFVFLSFSVIAVFASGFEFSLFKEKPLYQEAFADRYGYTSNLLIDFIPAKEDRSFDIMGVSGAGTYSKYYLHDAAFFESEPLYFLGKLSVNTSILRLGFDVGKVPVEASIDFNAYLNSMFANYSQAMQMGMDGSFYIGAAFRFDGKYVLRTGIHHLSGHYGDEIIAEYYDTTDLSNQDFLGFVEYVRDNDFNISFSASLPYGLRVYTSLDFPLKKMMFRPFAHVPEGLTASVNGQDMFERVGHEESVSDEKISQEKALKEGSGYYALIAHAGAEWTVDLEFADLVLGFDVYAHQDGQTNHNPGGYDKNNPWDFEYTAGLALDFNSKALVVQYHYGRPDVLNWFYKEPAGYLYLGFAIK